MLEAKCQDWSISFAPKILSLDWIGGGGGFGSLFPYPALHGLELVGCHSMARGEIACEIYSYHQRARPFPRDEGEDEKRKKLLSYRP